MVCLAYKTVDQSCTRDTEKKQEFGLEVGKGPSDYTGLLAHGCLQIHVHMCLAHAKSYFRG